MKVNVSKLVDTCSSFIIYIEQSCYEPSFATYLDVFVKVTRVLASVLIVFALTKLVVLVAFGTMATVRVIATLKDSLVAILEADSFL